MNLIEERRMRLMQIPGTMENYVTYDIEYLKHDQWWKKYSDSLRYKGNPGDVGGGHVEIVSTNNKDLCDVACQRRTFIKLHTTCPDNTLENILSLIPDRDVTIVFTVDPTMIWHDDRFSCIPQY